MGQRPALRDLKTSRRARLVRKKRSAEKVWVNEALVQSLIGRSLEFRTRVYVEVGKKHGAATADALRAAVQKARR